MSLEIERKFLVKDLPDLSDKPKETYERYFLYRGGETELRIQKVNGKFELERKSETSELGSETQKFQINKEEFESLKTKSGEAIVRDSFQLSKNPEITIKIYHGRFQGLVRAEVEFGSEKDARRFTPLPWMGKEITDTPLGRDSRLLDLSDEEFKDLLS